MAVNNPYIWGTGRRKTSTARVRIKPGTGKFVVNGKEMEAFFCTDDTRRSAVQALLVTETRNNYGRNSWQVQLAARACAQQACNLSSIA